MLEQLIANGLAAGCVTAILALGLAIIYNTTRALHIAHGAVFTLGAYFCYGLFNELSFPLWSAILLAILLCGIVGAIFELLVYAPLMRIRASSLVALIASLGMYIVIVNIIPLVPAFGNETKLILTGLQPSLSIGGVAIARMQLVQLLSAVLLLPGVLCLISYTRLGRMIRGVSDNPVLAKAKGINVSQVRLIALVLGSMLAGLAGILTGLDVGVDPHGGMHAVLAAAVAMILGGIGTFHGAVLGAFMLTILQSLAIWKLSTKWTDAVAYLLLILVLLFLPQGLVGQKRRLEEMRQ